MLWTSISPRRCVAPHLQREFAAVVRSINTLAARYQAAVSRERDLASELAHELRTPLALLTLQAHALRKTTMAGNQEQMLLQLERDALRAGQVLSDLLALARASRTELVKVMQNVDLDTIARGEVANSARPRSIAGMNLRWSVPDHS